MHQAAPGKDPATPPKHILLVDDDDASLALLRTLIIGNGFSHATASHGAEALDKARASPPAAIVADLLMPVMDGYTLLRQWKADPVLKSIPFLVYTATYTDAEDEQLAMDLGADAFISKYDGVKDLLPRLQQLMSAASANPPRGPVALEEAHLATYNERLAHNLESKTMQLHLTNRALLQEIAKRREVVSTQVSVLNALAAPVALIDPAGRITTVNEAWREFAGANGLRSDNWGIGQNYLEVCDQAAGINSLEAKHAAAGIRAVLSGELQRFEIEYECRSATQTHWYRLQVNPLSESVGAVIKHVDVTKQREAQIEFEQSEAQYLLLLNSTAEGIYRLDIHGVCTFCNPTAARLLGYEDPRQIVGRSAHEHHHHSRPNGASFPSSECPVHKALRTGQRMHADNEWFFRADGSCFPVEYWSYPILSGPDIAGTVVTFLDITLRRDLEAQFLQSQKMEAVGRLAGGVAHDFNNALQIILTYAELLEERLAGDPLGLEQNREILSAGRRAASLTRQLLALSRKQIQRPSLLDLNEVVGSVETVLRRTLGEDVNLTIHCARGLGTIEADRAQLEQVLINLAINARDAMPDGGHLRVTTSSLSCGEGTAPPRAFVEPGHYVVMSIRDSGIGMDEATAARIFEPFFTTKPPGKGTGLGLSTVYGIMKQSKGYVVVETEPGKGAEFRLFFPVVEGTPETMSPREASFPAQFGRETVLLVEDEDSLRSVVAGTLRTNGYTVLDAPDGNTALELAKSYDAPIDLLLTDLILPGISGRNTAEQLRQSHPSIKVIYMSGYTDDLITGVGIPGPKTVLLEKPFRIATLLLNIREVLDGAPAMPAGDAPTGAGLSGAGRVLARSGVQS
jgi:PAS domain S-box-containing protein